MTKPYSYNPQNQCYALPESDFERICQAANALSELTFMIGEMQLSKTIFNAENLACLMRYPAHDLSEIVNQCLNGGKS
ncbi:hypothetical protein [Alysiella crassa]|uniref:Uncharacterized protein n=1 Tax=Alysiella crassa TaxID=153491 RepID=A0A376BKR1_9NEIS|nr:hypothetical protein [Alysiella crassa]UOP07558.1 hypothetical protein LVJ80_03955 [Alysiella crassa]SSY70228.1 Uncharacterised protein [Alysiella crassa]